MTMPSSSPLKAIPSLKRSTTSTSESKITAVPTVSLVDILNNLPAPLIVILTELGPYTSIARTAAELISWRTSYSSCWLLLGFWWIVCLLSETIFRYMLPFLFLLLYYFRSHIKWSTHPHATESNIQNTVLDLSIIQQSLNFGLIAIPSYPLKTALRLTVALYIPYILLTHLLPLRVILGAIGTFFIIWRAPWARSLRSLIWRSAWIRRCILFIWLRITGQSSPKRYKDLPVNVTSIQPSKSIRFLFTIYENQRWWMGLDWTAALLPNERPSWSTATQEPISPPSTFNLPSPMSVVVGDGKGGMIKRNAYWSWGESEWKVIVKETGGVKARMEKPLSISKDDASEHTTSSGASRVEKTLKNVKDITKDALKDAKERVKDVGSSHLRRFSVQEKEGQKAKEDEFCEPASNTDVPDMDEAFTDGEGWIYGDNQWKGQSSQGGLGKFTRYRRWSRIGILEEVVEPAFIEKEQKELRHGRIVMDDIKTAAVSNVECGRELNVRGLQTNVREDITDHTDETQQVGEPQLQNDERYLRKRLKTAEIL